MLRSFNSLIILQCHPVVPKLELVGARLELGWSSVGARLELGWSSVGARLELGWSSLELVGARWSSLELVGARSVVVEKHGYRMAPRSFQILATMTKMSGSSSSQ
jgi:hypothetical protein